MCTATIDTLRVSNHAAYLLTSQCLEHARYAQISSFQAKKLENFDSTQLSVYPDLLRLKLPTIPPSWGLP